MEIVALLRCLFQEPFYTFITARGACAVSSLRIVDHPEQQGDGAKGYTRLISLFSTFP